MVSYNPSITPSQITTILKQTAIDTNRDNPNYQGLLGAGRIDAFKALTAQSTGLDNIPDLVWRNSDATGDNSVWKLNSDGTSNGGIILPPVPDTNFKIKFTPDIDGDGISDLVWQNSSTGQPAIWIMNSNGTIKSSTFVSTGNSGVNWQIVGVGKLA